MSRRRTYGKWKLGQYSVWAESVWFRQETEWELVHVGENGGKDCVVRRPVTVKRTAIGSAEVSKQYLKRMYICCFELSILTPLNYEGSSLKLQFITNSNAFLISIHH